MSHYVIQASYGAAADGAMVNHPQDRAAAVRPLIEKMDGKLHGMWLSFGEFDNVAVAEMPDAILTAATVMAIGASGAMSALSHHALAQQRHRSKGIVPPVSK